MNNNEILISKLANCKNCFKCLRECELKAIEYKNFQTKAIVDNCILCGNCINVCHQNAKTYRMDYEKVLEDLKNQEIVCSIAPSFIANFSIDNFNDFKNALLKIGFKDAFETIVGAKIVNNKYYEIMKNTKQTYITSSCPSLVKYISKYYPNYKNNLFQVLSPMVVHAKMLKEQYPNAKVCFIGPCIAKKEEIEWEGIVDYAITFEELQIILNKKQIKIENNYQNKVKNEYDEIVLYPYENGINMSMNKLDDYTYIHASGIKKVKSILDNFDNYKDKNYFLELSICGCSCLGGIGNIEKDYVISQEKITKYNTNDFFNIEYDKDISRKFNISPLDLVLPTEEEIRSILSRIGKKSEKDDLNCGSCGYDSCRDKAIAVFNGKAELSMCVPYLKERAESLANKLMDTIPFGVIALNNDLEIIEVNKMAYKIFDLKDKHSNELEIKDLINPFDVVLALEEQKNKHNIRTEYKNKHLKYSIIFSEKHNYLFLLIEDITEVINNKKHLTDMKEEAVMIADKVILKHMKSVQEIASLLGETTAETKIALTKLKELVEKDI